jgi:hypothetical protein
MIGSCTIRYCAATLLVLTIPVFGCHDGHDASTCKDIPCGAIPQPNGEYLCQWTNSERARAGQDRYVVYQYEWSAEPAKLTTAGQEHVVCMARDLGQVPYSIVIDPSPDARLNELRRVAVIEALAASGCPTDPARVCVGHPEAEGIYGQEVVPIARNMLSNQSGQGGTGGSSFGASSLGGAQGAGSSGAGSGGGMGVY